MARTPVAGPIVIPNCMEVKLHWLCDGEAFSNVLHGVYTAQRPINPALPETIFAAIKAATTTVTWMTHLDPACSLTGVSLKDLHTANQPETESTGLAMPGTGTGTPISLGSSLVITLRTAQTGQGFRGRVYLSGLTDAAIQNSRHFTATVGSDGRAFVDGLRTVMDGNTVPMCVAQRALNAGTHHDGTPWAARPAGTPDVTSVVLRDTRIDSQRRRLGR